MVNELLKKDLTQMTAEERALPPQAIRPQLLLAMLRAAGFSTSCDKTVQHRILSMDNPRAPGQSWAVGQGDMP